MNIDELHKHVKYKNTEFYNEFKEIIEASSYCKKYKLFGRYLFRTDCLMDSIKNRSYFFLDSSAKYLKADGSINFKNRSVKRYVDDNCDIYIGCVWLKGKGFSPIFISLKNNKYENLISFNVVNGYAISVDRDRYFNDDTAKFLGKVKDEIIFSNGIIYSSADLKSHFDQMKSANSKAMTDAL